MKERYIFNWRSGMWMNIDVYKESLMIMARREGELGSGNNEWRKRFDTHLLGYW